MKKIIAAFDGLKFSESTMQYAILLAQYHNAHLTGVFLEDITYHSYKIFELVVKEGVSQKKLNQLENEDILKRKNAVSQFEKYCVKAKLNFNVHHDKMTALQELLHEATFADLLVIDCDQTFTHYEEEIPSRFIRGLLEKVNCPVILVPKKFKQIDKIVFLYDGSPGSVEAIKTFAYLFPDIRSVDTQLLSIKNPHDNDHLPDNKLMKELMKRHFPRCTYTILKGKIREEIPTYVKTTTANILFVAGAYRRGAISMWLKRSIADFLMSEIKVPVFVSHT